jgi:hypothetical protein
MLAFVVIVKYLFVTFKQIGNSVIVGAAFFGEASVSEL